MKTGIIRFAIALLFSAACAGACHADCARLYALAQQHANDMARRNSVQFDHAAYPAARGTLQSMAYATADPAPLPEALRQVAAGPRPVRFSVGVCTARTASYPSGGYWVVVVFYSQ